MPFLFSWIQLLANLFLLRFSRHVIHPPHAMRRLFISSVCPNFFMIRHLNHSGLPLTVYWVIITASSLLFSRTSFQSISTFAYSSAQLTELVCCPFDDILKNLLGKKKGKEGKIADTKPVKEIIPTISQSFFRCRKLNKPC